MGELPPQAQVRLLRVLQSHEIERVGGTEPIPVDVRVLSATHRDLESMVRAGTFREDLWFRLDVFPIEIPPLRQRREDIRALSHHFLERKSRELKLGSPPDLAPGAMEHLLDYDWPGNVRELHNVLERALILHRSGHLDVPPLVGAPPDRPSPAETVVPARDVETGVADVDSGFATLDEAMAAHIEAALRRCGGKVHGPGGTAELRGVKANILRTRMGQAGRGVPQTPTRAVRERGRRAQEDRQHRRPRPPRATDCAVAITCHLVGRGRPDKRPAAAAPQWPRRCSS